MVAIFGLGGSEIVLILALILVLFGARHLPEFTRAARPVDYDARFDKNSLIDGITILLFMTLSFVVLACLRSKGLL